MGKQLYKGGYRAGSIIYNGEQDMHSFVVLVGFVPFEKQLGMVFNRAESDVFTD